MTGSTRLTADAVMLSYRQATLQLQIASARLLLQMAGPDRGSNLTDLLTFSRALGDATIADSIPAFRSAHLDQLRTAQAELDRVSHE